MDKPLRALIDAPVARAKGNPLAIELALHATGLAGSAPPRLQARLMREGARGGWVNGSLAWSGLDSWNAQSGDYRPDHLALVRELYAVHRAREGRAYYSYSYGTDKTIDLGGCDSVQLWSLLEEADRLGLKLVHARPGLGEVRHEQGELLIDVTQQGDHGSTVSTVLRVDGEDEDGWSHCCSSVPAGTAWCAPSAAARSPATSPRAGDCGSCVSSSRRLGHCSEWSWTASG